MTTPLTRPHWGGAAANVDIHLESYKGDIDRAFSYNSYFKGVVQVRGVGGESNTARLDRMGTATVKTRAAGGAVDGDRIVNEKFTVTVELTSYVRTEIDYQDEWTAPSRRAEISDEHGTAMALAYDEAHLIQLLHCRTWTPPASLVGKGFYNGIDKTATLTGVTDVEAQAGLLEKAHRDAVTDLVLRRVPLGECETLIRPEAFSILMDHKKLLNAELSPGNGDFAQRRIGMLNGIKVVELTVFPSAANASHPLGAAFNVTADDVLAQMVIYHKGKALVTVEAAPQRTRIWDDERNFTNVLDTFSMYTVGQRRPDYVAVISKDA